jgi:signal transduction histidine kinase
VKGITRDIVTFLFRSDPDSRVLWERYQLAITPKFYAVLSLLLLIASIRNVVNAAPPGPAVFMTTVVVLTTIAGYNRRDLFPRMTRITSFMFMPLVTWTCFEWPAGYPPPTLILLPLSALFIVFADHVAMATVYVVFSAGLLWYSGSAVPPGESSQYALLTAFAITTGMLYVSAVVLWLLLHRLFRSRTDLSGALESSLVLRQSLLGIFFDKLSAPLSRLEQQIGSATIAWDAVDSTAAEIRDILGQARKITLNLGARLNVESGNNEAELEHLRAQLWTFLLVAALVSCLAVIVADLVSGGAMKPLGVGAALVLGALIWMGARYGLGPRGRLAAVYVLTGFIAATCIQAFVNGQPPYTVLYFYIPVFCAAFISGTRHSVITALIAAGFLGFWYAAYPPLEGTPAFMRSNIALGLVFMLAFSHIVWTWLRQLLDEVAARHKQLRLESETRHRLMATLFHDIANPLQVVHGNAELAMSNREFAPNLPLLRSLVKNIRALVAFTRDFEELEKYGGQLPVEAVPLAPIFVDLRATFSDMLAAKALTLSLAVSEAKVLAHGELLGTSVLSNLLTNAIKFSPRGGAITIRTEQLPERRVRITIGDEGSGFSAAVAQQLQRGETIDSTAGTDGEVGDGQGLRLVTLYLQRMNGRLVVEAGSTIAVELPLAE